MQAKRLFDILEIQAAEFPRDDALVAKIDGQWKPTSTQDFVNTVNQVSMALLESGVQKGDRVSILANNRPEWNFVDIGILQIGAINVPIYPTISDKELQFILEDSEAKILFLSDAELFGRASSVISKMDRDVPIYTFDKVSGARHWLEWLAVGKTPDMERIGAAKDAVDGAEMATIIYTSGTTGMPKGVMLSHKNILSNVEASIPLCPINQSHRVLSFLPLNHIFERMITYMYMIQGISIYYAESIETIGDNIREVHPHLFTAVPRLLEKVYDKIMAKGQALTGIKRLLFFWAVNLGLRYELHRKNGWWYEFQLKLANKVIFNKWREALGGNIIALVSGSAALQPRLARVFSAAQIPVLEGYGLSETSPVISVNIMPESGRMFGSVGRVVEGVEVKIDENTGEILCKGPNVMLGYFKRDDLTAEVIDKDGWFHTGDKGTFHEGGFLAITGRIKEQFKTSTGKYVAPQLVENKFKESSLIEQIMVIGEYRQFVAALIVPSFDNLKGWCKKQGISGESNQEMISNPEVLKQYQSILEEYNPNFNPVEQIKKFELLPREWTIESGELTPTMKCKRSVIMEKCEDLVEKIYTKG